MKLKIAALCAILSAASVEAQQRFTSLPIGHNLGGYVSAIRIRIGQDGLGALVVGELYQYRFPQDGTLETFASQKLREAAVQLKPHIQYWCEIDALTEGVDGLLPAYAGSAESTTIAMAPQVGEEINFSLLNGEVPEEVFGKVKFQFGWGVGYYIPDVTDLEVNLYNGSRISRFSTRERIQEDGNSCELPAITLALKGGDVAIPNEIAISKTAWWKYAEITLYTHSEFVTFLVNRTEKDGTPIRWSNPPPSFFEPPAPKIASLKRVGNTTELLVEGNPDENVSIEWTPVLGGNWQPLKALIVPMSLNSSGKNITTHTTAGPSGFYRVRTYNSQKQ